MIAQHPGATIENFGEGQPTNVVSHLPPKPTALQTPISVRKRTSACAACRPVCGALYRAIQTSSRSAGSVAAVVSRKNGTHPRRSASTPPDDATIARPTAASDESSAYWVAVNAGEHRLERYATSAAPAIAPVIFSAATQSAR